MNGSKNAYARAWEDAGYRAQVIPHERKVRFFRGNVSPEKRIPLENKLQIPTPSVQEVEAGLKQWAHLDNYVAQEEALKRLFCESEFAPNNNLQDVLIKCSVLNDFYSTNIFNIYAMARHIAALKIDQRLAQGDPTLVPAIATLTISGTEKFFYSFATKYCSHHNPAAFPIYDSYVEDVLAYFGRVNPHLGISKVDLKVYSKFKAALLSFKEVYGLQTYSFKDLDHYLWLLGKKYFPKSFKSKNR